ncbi:MAG: MotA/TolQ/ExbB proton channel family protein [Phycisphaerales bacterium JB060]
MEALANGIRHWFEVGGWVMVPLALVSVLGLTIVFERVLFWARLTGPAIRTRTSKLAARLRSGDFAGVIKSTAERRDPYSRLARELSQDATGPIGEAQAREAIEAQRYAVERFQGALSIIITAAPMLGILGTVTGIITSFAAIGEVEGGDPRLVAGGIAQALYTTAFGLAIAVATLFPYAIFKGLADRALTRLELLAASAMEGSSKPTAPPTGG